MKIAHLVTSGEIAGGQVIALELARAAHRSGHEVLFLSPTRGSVLERASDAGLRTELVDVTRTIRLAGAVKLARLLRRLEVDLLHTHVHVAAAVLGRLAARTAGAAVVSHLHIENHFRPQRLARAPLVLLDNATARLCSRMIAVSEATRDAFVQQGFPANRIETIYNGVDVASIDAAPRPRLRAELDLAEGAVLIALVGRLAPVKGQRELIHALARIRPLRPQVQLVLIGADTETGGAYERELRQLCASLRLEDDVRFAGFRPDAAAALGDVDALALPSWIEGLPVVVLEAMAQRRPVVATRVGGTPEAVVDGETGLLVPPRDVARLAEALDRLVSDPALRRRLGDAGRARVQEQFSAESAQRRVLEVYGEVSSRR